MATEMIENEGAAPEPEATVPPTSDMPDNENFTIENASPEEQAQYDKIMLLEHKLVYGNDDMFDKIVDLLDGGADGEDGGDPIKGLAIASEMVFARIGAAAEQGGEHLSPAVALHAGAEILEDLADVSQKANIHDFSQDPDGLEAAWFEALDLFRARLQQSGELDQGAAAEELKQLMAMDQNGTLNTIMRNLASNDEAGEAGGPPDNEAAEGRPAKTRGFGAATEDA